ncbi:TonB-dependent receptor plug domain-containing protein [endosymbiont of Lamellibrachia barhami]|uniref:TonB-dependent receptor plug domain-containing protein n=1 Tax=endosymbiont of Lamellibrachia barhami TaxID=205975 RepID=UPI0015B132AA|nr:TonB-dependent receptor [endosymbiont of Lamellibrachia barhami]
MESNTEHGGPFLTQVELDEWAWRYATIKTESNETQEQWLLFGSEGGFLVEHPDSVNIKEDRTSKIPGSTLFSKTFNVNIPARLGTVSAKRVLGNIQIRVEETMMTTHLSRSPVHETGAVSPLPCGLSFFGRYARHSLLSLALAVAAPAQADTDLLQFALEDLMSMKVTSAAKKPQSLFETTAAVFVITQDDIRRSGAVALPDLLRMVPGMNVARIDANKWAVSARGFNDLFSNKLLVMLDGRSVYTPLFSGVYWDTHDIILQDIERIEVIRGPGGTLWGANAVNGVINIITKNAHDTVGNLATATLATQESGSIAYRYGGENEAGWSYRVFGKAREQGEGPDGADDWRIGRIGFRADREACDECAYTLSGEIYQGTMGERFDPAQLRDPYFHPLAYNAKVSGGHLLAHWERGLGDGGHLEAQTYFDHAERNHFYIEDSRSNFDLDVHYRFPFGEQHEIHLGGGWRYTTDDTSQSLWYLGPGSRSDQLWSAFIQDEITIDPGVFSITIGSKFEHNDYTGFEFQPSARFLWTPGSEHSVWGSASRAVRTPSRIEHDGNILRTPLPPPDLYLSIEGDRRMESEILYAYELGYRFQPRTDFLLDLALFYNDYDKLRSLEPGELHASPSHLEPHLQFPLVLDNKLSGETYGLELAARWKPLRWWEFQLAYSYLNMHLSATPDSGDTTEVGDENDSPKHQVFLRSNMQLSHDWELTTDLRYAGETMREYGKILDGGEEYLNLDLRLGWQASPGLELALGGRNLLGSQKEFRSSTVEIQATEAEPTYYGELVWRF